MTDDLDDDINEMLGQAEITDPAKALAQKVPSPNVDTGDSIDDFMSDNGLAVQRTVPDITKPWMKHHHFKLVSSIKELNDIVDAALKAGRCALDLETEGLDNRIFYRADGSPYTKHQIVGFCLSYDGVTGYYAPVRHAPDGDDNGKSLNLPIAEAEAAITRLCRASQPIPAPGAADKDPLSFKEFARAPEVVLYFWHAKFDQEFLFPITGIDWWHPESFEDGNLAYFTYYSGDKRLSLKDKAVEELRDIEGNPHEMIKLKELFIQGRREVEFAKLSPDEPGCVKYACSDAINTFLLCVAPRPHEKSRVYVTKVVREKYGFTYRLEKQTAEAVRWMERPRVRVNRAKVEAIRSQNVIDRDALAAKISALAIAKSFHGFKPGSAQQLSEFLFDEKGLNITLPINTVDFPNGKPPLSEKSKTKQHKTDADTLERLLDEHPDPPEILKWIVQWRKYEKLDGTYLNNLVTNVDERGEMRFQFKQTGTATGRFSAPNGDASQGYSGIPIHGIPGTSVLRQAFEARDGYTMVKADFAGEELRIAANVSGEMVWINEFLEGDGDLHSITARAFFGKQEVSKDERKMGKIANFALVYGGGPSAIMRATGCDKLEGTRRKQAFDKAVPTFAQWIKGQHAYVRKNKGIWTAFGRWIAIPDIDNPDRMIASACERHSTNYPIQGAGADIMKICLVLLCKEFYKRGWLKQGGGSDSIRMLLSVHDEIVFEIKHALVQEALVVITRIMSSPTYIPQSPKWRVPLVVEPLIGLNWGAECDYGMLMHGRAYKAGEKVKDHEIVVGERIYHRVPAWLDGMFIPPYLQTATPHEGGGGTPPTETPVAMVADSDDAAPAPEPVVEVKPPTPPAVVAPAVVAPVVAAPAPAKPVDLTAPSFCVKLGILTKHSVKQVRKCIASAMDPDLGKVLVLMDGTTGRALIDETRDIRVIPERFAQEMRELNLSDGQVYPHVRQSATT
jgi:DNA polymerase I-like protein with 3'-5' exonuclease and polymerase domains